MAIRPASVTIALGILVAACGGGDRLTLVEYAGQVEGVVASMEADFVALDREWESQPPSLEGARSYFDRRLEIREDFLDAIEGLDPPSEVGNMHETSVDLFSRITDADVALAERVDQYETVTEHRQWRDTPEAQASLRVLEEVYAFCRESQAAFDATQDPQLVQGSAWVRPEVREVVAVAFGCPE